MSGVNNVKIGMFSASTPISAIAPQRYLRAVNFLKQQGVSIVAGSLTGKSEFYRSGSILQRAQEINALIYRKDIPILMAAIGGNNTNSVLPYVDFTYLNQHPKTIIGYSDTTALLLAVQTQAPNCRVIYGPAVVASFGEWSPYVDWMWQDLQAVLQANATVTLHQRPYWSEEAINWESWQRPKKHYVNQWRYTTTPSLTGRIMGGNLNTMAGIFGTKYFPQLKTGDILLLEDAQKDATTIERSFAHLKAAGVFDQISGLILGKHALFDDQQSHWRPIDILQEVLNDPNLPIIYDYDSCHTVPMLPTVLGAQVKIDAISQTVRFDLSHKFNS